MTAKDFLIAETLRVTDALFEAARKVPADKLEWKPLDNGRSVLAQLQECAQSPTWGASVVKAGKFEWTPEMMETARQEQQAWATLEACEQECNKNVAALIEMIRTTPDEEMEKTIMIPFGKDHNWKIIDIFHLHAWNATYHTGQINYIQTLYGDTSMG